MLDYKKVSNNNGIIEYSYVIEGDSANPGTILFDAERNSRWLTI